MKIQHADCLVSMDCLFCMFVAEMLFGVVLFSANVDIIHERARPLSNLRLSCMTCIWRDKVPCQ